MKEYCQRVQETVQEKFNVSFSFPDSYTSFLVDFKVSRLLIPTQARNIDN